MHFWERSYLSDQRVLLKEKGRERGIRASALGRNILFPLSLHPLFQSQEGHSLIRQVASPLSPKMNCMHYDVTRQCISRGAKYSKSRVILLRVNKNITRGGSTTWFTTHRVTTDFINFFAPIVCTLRTSTPQENFQKLEVEVRDWMVWPRVLTSLWIDPWRASKEPNGHPALVA